MEKRYEISERELKRLLIDSAKLSILENDGVDNWSYYMYGTDEYIESKGYDPNEYDYEDVAVMEVEDYKELKDVAVCEK